MPVRPSLCRSCVFCAWLGYGGGVLRWIGEDQSSRGVRIHMVSRCTPCHHLAKLGLGLGLEPGYVRYSVFSVMQYYSNITPSYDSHVM